jgi:hypothetical protein
MEYEDAGGAGRAEGRETGQGEGSTGRPCRPVESFTFTFEDIVMADSARETRRWIEFDVRVCERGNWEGSTEANSGDWLTQEMESGLILAATATFALVRPAPDTVVT